MSDAERPPPTWPVETGAPRALREAYGDALLELAEQRSDFAVLDSDLSRSTFTDGFAKAHPGCFYNAGIAEQNMVGVAAGLSLTGVVPFVTTYAIFIGRAFDQIRQSVCYAGTNVKIVATHAGLAASFDGGSHQGLEDLALMRVLPGMTLLSPADYNEARAAVSAALEHRGPVYLRLQKEPTPVFTEAGRAFRIGETRSWGTGKDVLLVGTGTVVHACLEAARELEKRGFGCRVLSMSTLKPLPAVALVEQARACRTLVSVEEHMQIGGLHEAVCAAIAGRATPAVGCVAMRDRFGETGSWPELKAKYGFTRAGILHEAQLVLRAVQRGEPDRRQERPQPDAPRQGGEHGRRRSLEGARAPDASIAGGLKAARRLLAVQFRGAPLLLEVPGGADALDRFLNHYLTPFFSMREADASERSWGQVSVFVDAPPGDTPSFRSARVEDVDRSGGFLRCRGRSVDREDTRWVRLDPFGVTVRIERDHRRVALFGSDELRLQVPVMRVIEDLTVLEMERRGALYLHASAVVSRAGCVVAAGNKKAGKTTILCRALHGFSVSKLANDNVVVWVEDGRVQVRGWPGFFKVDLATVALNEELAPFFPEERRDLLPDTKGLWEVYEKVAFFPAQGAELFGAGVVPQAPLAALLLPRFDPDSPPTVEPCRWDGLVEELVPCLQGSRHPNHPDWMGLGLEPTERLRDSLRVVLRAAEGHAQAYALLWSPSVDDLLTTVPALSAHRRSIERAYRGRGSWTSPPLPPVLAPPDGNGES